MANPLILLKFLAKGALNFVGGGIGGDLVCEVIPEIAADVWEYWHRNRNAKQRKDDLAALAQAPPAEVKQQVAAIIEEVAHDKPAAAKEALAIYLSLVPAQIRKSLRRPADPQGVTCPHEMLPQTAEDLMPLLPAQLPRFKVGDRPLPSVDWELDELLGAGGFGEVWKARNPLLSSVPPVALKFCLDPSAARYLQNEAAALNRVMRDARHPGIVRLERTYGLTTDTPCLEYEFVSGGDLASLIQQWHRGETKPSFDAICAVFLDLARIIAFAHQKGIVHRDLKPANILREPTSNGYQLKVADFGIGGVASRTAIVQNTQGTSRGLFLHTALRGSCTPLYAGPQQMRGDAPDPRDDVYSLGVIWYQMLTGDLTKGRPGGVKWQKRLQDQGLEPRFLHLMAECFEDQLEDRLEDAGELVSRLERLLPLDDTPLPPTVINPPLPSPGKPALLATPPRFGYTSLPGSIRPDSTDGRRKRELESRLADLVDTIYDNPETPGPLLERGEILRQLGRFDKAVEDCTAAIRIDPQLSGAYATRGSAYRMQGELDLAIADCSSAIKLDAGNVLAWYNRGEAYRLKGKPDLAIADCSRALELDKSYSWAWGTRGAARQTKGEHALALADLDETIRLDPGYAWAWAVRGETWRLQGDHDRAIADCSEALKRQPNLSMALATRGAAFRQKGDFATATADLDQALRANPGYQWARDQLELARRRIK